jgi:Flp pilus assembly protein TadD
MLRYATGLYLALLLFACIGVDAFLTYRLTYPPRTLLVRIATDSLNPAPGGITSEELRRRVESVSRIFNREAGVRLSFAGLLPVKMLSEVTNAAGSRRVIETMVPRDDSDIILAFTPLAKVDGSLGSAPAFASVAVVRLDNGSQEKDDQVLAHLIGGLFGLVNSSDPRSLMHDPPGSDRMDPVSSRRLMDLRLFDFHKGLGNMSNRMGRRVLAVLEEQAPSGANTTAWAHNELGVLLQRDSQNEAAAEQFEAALKGMGSDAAVHVSLARALSATARFPAAEKELQTAIRLAPDQPEAHHQLGIMRTREHREEEALAEFRRAIGMSPKIGRYHGGYAVALAMVPGRYGGANAEIEEAQRLDPKDPDVRNDGAIIMRLRARLQTAVDSLDADLRRVPDDGMKHYQRGLLLLQLGKVQESTGELNRAIALSPNRWEPHYTRALAFLATGKTAEARAELQVTKNMGGKDTANLERQLAEKGAS